MDALDMAIAITGGYSSGVEMVTSWARGNGPYEGTGTWEYTRPSKDAPDIRVRCNTCERCDQGRCVKDPEACPDCTSCGDVHISTLDGLRYDLQSVGEFILLESEDGRLTVQVRQQKYGRRVSVNRAVAMNVGGDRISVTTKPELTLTVNGDPSRLVIGSEHTLTHGGLIQWRSKDQLRVQWPDGSLVVLSGYVRGVIDVSIHVSDMLKGKVAGLAGNANSDPSDDLAFRNGDSLPDDDPLTIHGVFADSWRIKQDESLFDYAAGENTETFTDREFPAEVPTLDSLSDLVRFEAELVCREAGVVEPRLLRDCILDVGLSGDSGFALSHVASEVPQDTLPTGDQLNLDPQGAGLTSPGSAKSGSLITVDWAGTGAGGDLIAIAHPSAQWSEWLNWQPVTGVQPVQIIVPDRPGEYEIRYIQGRRNLILAYRPLTVTAAAVELIHKAEVTAGTDVSVDWSGPGKEGDYLSIANPGAPANRYQSLEYVRDTSPLDLIAPDTPGDYEVRYIQGQSRTVLARSPVKVNAVAESLQAQVDSASGQLLLRVTANGNPLDSHTYASKAGTGEEVDRANSDGEVLYHLEPGTYSVRVRPHGIDAADRVLEELTITAGRTLERTVDYSSGQVQVTVTANGEPLNARTYIYHTDSGKEASRDLTNEEGIASYAIPVGEYRIRVRPDGIDAPDRKIEGVVVKAGGITRESVNYSSGRAEVTVTANGEPLNARTYIYHTDSGKEASRDLTNEEGIASYDIPVGEYRIRIRPDGIDAPDREIEGVVVKEGETTDISVDFEK